MNFEFWHQNLNFDVTVWILTLKFELLHQILNFDTKIWKFIQNFEFSIVFFVKYQIWYFYHRILTSKISFCYFLRMQVNLAVVMGPILLFFEFYHCILMKVLNSLVYRYISCIVHVKKIIISIIACELHHNLICQTSLYL